MSDTGAGSAAVGDARGAAGTAAGTGSEDWAAETAGRLEEIVTKIRSQTTDRIVKVARVLVFGVLLLVMGIMLGILALIALVRALDELIPQEVWLVYIPIGAIFTVIGRFFWSKAKQPPTEKA